MIFYLTSDDENRVFLDSKPQLGLVDTIDADPECDGKIIVRSAWQVAREKISERKYFHERGHGYYLKSSNGKSLRVRRFDV